MRRKPFPATPLTNALHVLPGSGGYTSEVANPELAGRLSFELAIHFVVWAWLSGIRVCGDDLLPSNNTL